MNEYQETYEKEISLIELMFYCLKKWRWIVTAMLVMAVLAGGYKYRATVKDNAAKREAELNSDIKGENQKKEVVTNPNIEYYELAIDNTQQNLDTMKDYIDNSVIMNLDAYHLNTGILSFYIHADNANDAMLGNLMAAYKTFATDGRLAEALQAAGSKMETSEVQYLIKFDTEELSATEQNANGDATSTVLIAGSQKKPTVFQVQITAEMRKSARHTSKRLRRHLMSILRSCREKSAPMSWSYFPQLRLSGSTEISSPIRRMSCTTIITSSQV